MNSDVTSFVMSLDVSVSQKKNNNNKIININKKNNYHNQKIDKLNKGEKIRIKLIKITTDLGYYRIYLIGHNVLAMLIYTSIIQVVIRKV